MTANTYNLFCTLIYAVFLLELQNHRQSCFKISRDYQYIEISRSKLCVISGELKLTKS